MSTPETKIDELSTLLVWQGGQMLTMKAEIERLRAALKPFAEVPPHSPPERRCMVMVVSSGPYHFLQSDLDRAKAIYKEPLVNE